MKRLALSDVAEMVTTLQSSSVRSEEVRHAVAAIIDDVRRWGDAALRQYTKQFDGVSLPAHMSVSQTAMKRALAALPPELSGALKIADSNIQAYHKKEVPVSWRASLAQGQTVGQEMMPLEVAGLYVPGGLANYPSSVLMTAIPAQVAGVKRLVICSPPRKDGLVASGVAAVCSMLGVRDLFPVGGAQAVAAMAFGTESVPRCDIIAGPGNLYVTEAKRQVMGEVAIDSLAGPSEVLIVADEEANPLWLATDVMAQAEHGAGAMGAVLSMSPDLSNRLADEVTRLSAKLGIDIENVSIVDCSSTDAAVDLVNAFAPEHLELHVADPNALLKRIRNAGAVFLGTQTATAFADYAAGTNHVLPTGGSARFAQGLSASAFVKRVGVLELDGSAATELAPAVSAIAREEGLIAHALSAELRGGIAPDDILS